jgi:hypothetical protein
MAFPATGAVCAGYGARRGEELARLVSWLMNRRRMLGAATVGVLLSSRGSARASAPADGRQQNEPGRPKSGGSRGGPVPVPVLLNLKDVPVGSWAEYTIVKGGRPPRTVRQVLVDRDDRSATVELIMEVRRRKAPKSASPAWKVTRMVVDLELREIAPREVVVQRSGSDPMARSTAQVSGRQRMFKLDPKRSLGSETVAVAAGAFDTQHYRDIGPRGGTIDIWASQQVPPFGLVKMERSPSASAPARRAAFGKVTYALVRVGGGGRASITRAARPLHPSLMQCPVDVPKKINR